MTKDADALVGEALRLPAKERARIAADLLASLDDGPDEGVEAAWAEEIERRARRVLAGEGTLESWQAVRDRLRPKR